MTADTEQTQARARARSLRPLVPWLVLAAALSVAAMVLGAGRGDHLYPALAAGVLAVVVVAAGLWRNAPLWSVGAGAGPADATKSALVANICLAAFVYAWGAAALFAVYSLSDLYWRHAWQYGLGAVIFALGLAIYGRSVDATAGSAVPPFSLTLLHGAAVGGGLAYLLGTGKLATQRTDWVANDVFLAGGLSILALCVIAAVTQRRATAA